MELPIFNKEQPGCTYYYSPMTVNNLGMVDHAHKYPNGQVGEHMHCHVYTDAVGKKGANNVASLIMKTLRGLNLLKKDTIGRELNIIFDNCRARLLVPFFGSLFSETPRKEFPSLPPHSPVIP